MTEKNFQFDAFINFDENYNYGFDTFDRVADQQPADIALITVDSTDLSCQTTTYLKLKNRSNQLANFLYKTLQVTKGERLLAMIPRTPFFYETLLACHKLGIVPCPTTMMASEYDLEYRINSAQVSTVICFESVIPKIKLIESKCPSLKHKIAINSPNLPPRWYDYETEIRKAIPQLEKSDLPKPYQTHIDDILILFFTSGTTGKPKMVRHLLSYAVGQFSTAIHLHQIKRGDVIWGISDTGWAKFAYSKFYGQFFTGSTVLQYNQHDAKFDPIKVLTVLQKHKVNVFCCPPTAYRMLIRENLAQYQCPDLRNCLSAGEPLNPEVINIWKKGMGLTIHEHYGQSETALVLGNFPPQCMEGSMGRPAPGIEAEVLDENGKIVPVGEEGIIAVKLHTNKRNYGIMKDYWKDEEMTAKVFKHGYYYTQDKAYRTPDGYFWFLGRSDDVFKSSGYRISPFEVESCLIEHPRVVESAVIPIPDPEMLRGLIIKAYIVLGPLGTNTQQSAEDLKKEIQEFVKRRTAPYKYPREIEFVEALPKTISGKIRRVELRQKEAEKLKSKL